VGTYRTRRLPPPRPLRAPRTFPVHEGRRTIVTGAAGHLGRATAELLARQGATVFLSDLHAESVADAVRALTAHGDVHGGAMDVGDHASIGDGIAQAMETLGGVDGLVNCAAIVNVASEAGKKGHIDSPAGEVARTISYPLSDDALLIRGQALDVDAGDTVG